MRCLQDTGLRKKNTVLGKCCTEWLGYRYQLTEVFACEYPLCRTHESPEGFGNP